MPEIEEDVPPAGTACAVCKSLGHYCPAKQFIFNGDAGICEPCAETRDCDWVKARATAPSDDPFMIPKQDKVEEPMTDQIGKKCVHSRCRNRALEGRRFCTEHVLDHQVGRPKTLPETVAKAKELRGSGLPIRAVAEELGIGTVCEPNKRTHYDAVIADVEEKIAVLWNTLETLRAFRDAC